MSLGVICPLLSFYLFLSSILFLVLTGQSDYSAPVGCWHGGEEGMDARGSGDVHSALVLWQYHLVKNLLCLTVTRSAWYLMEIAWEAA